AGITASTFSTVSGYNTLILDSTQNSIGTSSTALSFSAANFSATAANGAVYLNDTSAGSSGTITIINPNTFITCCPTISSPNSAASAYFIEASNAGSTTLATASGVSVATTGGGSYVTVVSDHGSVGTSTTAFAVNTPSLTAQTNN